MFNVEDFIYDGDMELRADIFLLDDYEKSRIRYIIDDFVPPDKSRLYHEMLHILTHTDSSYEIFDSSEKIQLECNGNVYSYDRYFKYDAGLVSDIHVLYIRTMDNDYFPILSEYLDGPIAITIQSNILKDISTLDREDYLFVIMNNSGTYSCFELSRRNYNPEQGEFTISLSRSRFDEYAILYVFIVMYVR